MPLPAVRPLDAFPFENSGAKYVCLSDPTGLIEDQLILSPMAYLVATGLNGSRELPHVQQHVARLTGGVLIPTDQILELVQRLDDHGFLDTETFHARRREVEAAFRARPARRAHLAGKAYSDDPHALREAIDRLFTKPDGPGAPAENVPAENNPNGAAHLPGLIVPHIDYGRGGVGYAHGYHELARHARPDTVIVFGVAHVAEPAPFILTRKTFETPLGAMETDKECLDQLEAACAWDPYAFELTHRTEHSVELQAVMLARFLGPETRIVPILCSMFPDESRASDPASDPGVAAFLDACAQYVAHSGKRVTVLASADLAHVGRRFGDDFDIDDGVIAAVNARDSEDMAHAHGIDAAEFYRSVMSDRNARKVCGVNCIYAALKTLEGRATRGTPLHYGYAPDPAGGIVSFATVALY